MKALQSKPLLRRLRGVLALLPLIAMPALAMAADTTGTPLRAPVWLCKPGQASKLCNQDAQGNPQGPVGVAAYPSGAKVPLNATVVRAQIASGTEPFLAQAAPKVDCFYVYPTVDVLPNPFLSFGATPPAALPAEAAILLAQVGLLSAQCRMFAPLYRQATLLHIAQGITAGTDPFTGPGFADVQQAWDDYWAKDNIDASTGKRRGVILLGHSQGSVALSELIKRRFDGNAVTSGQLISALLIGGRVMVPTGGHAGGGNDPDATFQHLPMCHRSPGAPLPTACVVAYASYSQAAGSPPVSGSMGESAVPGHQIACVNPGALLMGTDSGATVALDAYLPTQTLVQGNFLSPNGRLGLILTGFKLPRYPTGFARYPDLLTGTCMHAAAPTGQGNVTWLQIDGGQSIFPASVGNSVLGLHVLDYNVAMGTLRALLAAQASVWLGLH